MKNTKFAIYHSPRLEIFQQERLCCSFPEHFHEHYVIGCLLSGKRNFYCADKSYQLLPGQLVTLNPGQIHKCAPESNFQSSWLAIHFPSHTVTQLFSNGELFFQNPIVVDNLSLSFLLKLANDPRDANLNRLLLRLLCPYGKNNVAHKFNENLFTAVKTIYQDFVAKNYNPVSMEESASKANMGKFTFLRKFRKHMGISPYRYLENIRLNKAKKQILQGMPISQCAQELGFHDQSHLNRQFRDIFGFTPGVLRSVSLLCKKKGG